MEGGKYLQVFRFFCFFTVYGKLALFRDIAVLFIGVYVLQDLYGGKLVSFQAVNCDAACILRFAVLDFRCLDVEIFVLVGTDGLFIRCTAVRKQCLGLVERLDGNRLIILEPYDLCSGCRAGLVFYQKLIMAVPVDVEDFTL